MCNSINDARLATESGYWPLYRYNPTIVEDLANNKHRFQLDSKRLKGDLEVRVQGWGGEGDLEVRGQGGGGGGNRSLTARHLLQVAGEGGEDWT